MPQTDTTQVFAAIDTTLESDPYATHKSWRGQGGWREVSDLTSRDAITTERRHQGMAVWVVSEQKMYVLKTGVTNSDWVEFVTSSGGNLSGTLMSGKIPVATGTNTLGDSSLTQTINDVNCAGQLTATNLSGTNTGDQDLSNMPTTTQKAALDNANLPSASNPFITSGLVTSIKNAENRTYSGTPLYLSNDVSVPKTIYNFFQVNKISDVEKPSTETILPTYITQNPYSDFIRAFRYTPDYKTAGINGGVTIAKLWGAVSDITYNTYITGCCYHIKKYVGDTVTITGSGTSRTAITTNYPFIYGVNTDKRLAPYLETPSGVFQVIGFGGAGFVLINTPSDYINETAVSFKQWIKLYDFNTGNITQTTTNSINCFSAPQNEYSIFNGNAWGEDDEFGIIFYADTSSVSTPIKVDFLYAGNAKYSHLDIHGLLKFKSLVVPVETNLNYNSRRAREISGTGTFNFNFTVPADCKEIVSAYLICYPSVGAAGSSRNIDLSVEYNNNPGESYNLYNASDLSSVYDLTGYANKRYHLYFTPLLASATHDTEGGLTVDLQSVGGVIDFTHMAIIYI